jgi:uncharacterized protein with von Willebrand factor type A (vWA) domain
VSEEQTLYDDANGGFDELFVEFAHSLRGVGLTIGSDDVISFCQATAELNPANVMDIYWSGRTTMVRRRENISSYNIQFQKFFLDISPQENDPRKVKIKSSISTASTLDVPNAEEGQPGNGEEEAKLGFMAATNDIWRSKAFAECTPSELASLRKMISTLKVNPPFRRTRRLKSTLKGNRIDMRKMVRETMRSHGDPQDIFFSKRKEKLRTIIFILDVSGSMADYSRNLLQMAYSARKANTKVEVFCFGTRLTRITTLLKSRNPDQAMERAGESVLDWDGGTRIGDCLKAFIKGWGRTRLGRGSIVIICSDGLDRGDPAVLVQSMEELARIAYKVLWMNPHKGDSVDFLPNTMGMIVADPFIDQVVSGHNLKSLEEFSRTLAGIR